MSERFSTQRFHNLIPMPTTTTTVVIGPIDIGHFANFAMLYQNSNTAIGFIGMQLQAAYDSSATAADQSPQWFNIPTATLAQPSALGPTATVWASMVNPNPFKWLRVIGATSSTAIAGSFSITVAGRMAN